jgi:hypothetical protein
LRRHPRLQRPTYILWLLGVIELATGAAFTSRAVLAAGWSGLLAATALLCANLHASLRAAPRPLSLQARLLALAHTFLLAGLTVALIATIQTGAYGPFGGSTRNVLAVLLLAGWIGMTVTGSLLHLLAILARIRRTTDIDAPTATCPRSPDNSGRDGRDRRAGVLKLCGARIAEDAGGHARARRRRVAGLQADCARGACARASAGQSVTDATADRLTVPTCIGCGAMSQLGSCETGCSEHKLELVRAVAHDALIAAQSNARTRADAFEEPVRRLASHEPGVDEFETEFRSAQSEARDLLRSHPDANEQTVDWEQPAEHATTWWCAKCGGVDAPQPCLGICVWRPVEWVNRDVYQDQRERATSERERERRLRQVLRRIAWITPHPHQWERSWRLLQAEAEQALDTPPGSGTLRQPGADTAPVSTK